MDIDHHGQLIKSSDDDQMENMMMMMQMAKLPDFSGSYNNNTNNNVVVVEPPQSDDFAAATAPNYIPTTSFMSQLPPSSLPILTPPLEEPLASAAAASTAPNILLSNTTGNGYSNSNGNGNGNSKSNNNINNNNNNNNNNDNNNNNNNQKQNNSMAAMREMIFRMAVMQPIHIDPESVKPPKRRNVKISKDPQSVAARHRRERISERIRILQRLVPGGTKMDTASMLDEAIHYVKFLKNQVQSLERSAAAANNIRPTPPPPPTGIGFPVAMSTGTYFPNSMGKPYQLASRHSHHHNVQHFGEL